MRRKIATLVLISFFLVSCASTGGLTPAGKSLVKTLVETAVTVAYLEAPEARITLNTICALKSNNVEEKTAKIKELLGEVWTASNTQSAFIAATAINGLMSFIDNMIKEKVSDNELAVVVDEIITETCASVANVSSVK